MESVAAMLILGFSTWGVLQLQTSIIHATALSSDISLASNIAASGIEMLRISDFQRINGDSVCPPADPTFDLPCQFTKAGAEVANPNQAYFVLRWNSVPDASGAFADVTVNVTWNFRAWGYNPGAQGTSIGREREVTMRARVYPR